MEKLPEVDQASFDGIDAESLLTTHLVQALVRENRALLRENQALLRENEERSRGQSELVPSLLADLQREKAALEDSEARFAGVFDSPAIGMVLVSMDGEILRVNRAAYEMLGYAEGEVDSLALARIIHPADWEKALEHARKMIDGTLSVFQTEKRCLRKQGDVIWVLLSVYLVRNDPNGASYFVSQLQDITEKKRAEDALRHSEERFRTIFENAPILIDGFDANGRCVLWNRECEKVFGWTQAELNAQGTPLALFYPDPEIRKNVERSVACEPKRDFLEWNPFTKDGRELTTLWANFALPDGSVINLGYDVTAQRKAEAERAHLDAQDRQIHKSESLSRMAGAIAHHFNNQLHVVRMSLELAINELSWAKDGAAMAYLMDCRDAAVRASEVSSLMLTYLGQTVGKQEPVDLSEFCQYNLRQLQSSLPTGLTLETDFPSPGPLIKANGQELYRVLHNLVTNAWESGSRVTRISVGWVHSSEIPERYRFPIDFSEPQPNCCGYACLAILDQGSGIPPQDIEKLFDPFFSRKFTGRGLGLPVALGIVRAHGGAISVESSLGRGSQFRIYLPLLIQDQLPKPSPPPASSKAMRAGLVLVVDDEGILRRNCVMTLQREGFTVVSAQDGREAVDVVRRFGKEIRCVLCDVSMPHMDGWETLSALRALVPGLPVILTSGHSEALVMEGDHPELPQSFLSKPYERVALVEAIDRVLASTVDSSP